MPTPEPTSSGTDQPPPAAPAPDAPPPDVDGAADDGGLLRADASLQKLESRLDDALAELSGRNRSVEEYLDTLAQQRKRELEGANADQLTIDDIPQPPAAVPPPHDAVPPDPTPNP